MFKIKLKDILKVYSKIKLLVFKSYNKNDIDRIIKYSDILCFSVYRFNWIFADNEIEDLLLNVANNNFKKGINTEKLNNNRIVFYDQIGSIECLGLQYLRGLFAAGLEVLYIFESSTRTCSPILLEEIKKYEKSSIICVNSSVKNKVAEIEKVRNQIIEFNSAKALLHCPAEGAFGVILWNSLAGIKRFRIVPGDHHFYLGTKCSDYFIEFRKFGYTTAVQKRGIDNQKVFILPYYPIVGNPQFMGFGEDTNNKIIIFSAAAVYKVYGENQQYFELLKQMINKHSNIIVLFAGDGYLKPFEDFIKENGFQNNIKLLGYRKDLNMCIANSDIYLTTFPHTGALTTQYAAYHSKPILSYTTPNLTNNFIEEIIGCESNHTDSKITHTDINDFIDYSDMLINDIQFRVSEGKRVKNLLTTVEKFNYGLSQILDEKALPYEKEFIKIDYNKLLEQNIEVENKYIPMLKYDLIKYFKFNFLLYFPYIIINVFCSFKLQKYIYARFLKIFRN